MISQVCDVFKEAYRRGWITSRDGNASVRIPGQDWFYVTPSGVRKNQLIDEMFIKLDIAANGTFRERWVEAAKSEKLPKQQLSQGLMPSGELPLHWLLQRFNPTTHPRVVLHLHPTHVIAAIEAGIDLHYLSQKFPEINRYTRVAASLGYIKPVSEDLGYAVAGMLLKDNFTGEVTNDVVGLARHGAVSVGIDAWEAFEHIERLNHICEIELLAQGTGSEL